MEKEIKNQQFLKVLEYIENSIWQDDTKNEEVIEIAQKYVKSLPKNLKKEKVLHRVTGQSGSGKTTQIMKSLCAVFEKQNIEFCHIAVRNFAKYHPNYENIKQEFGTKHIREKTNGFALKCLVYVLKYMFEANFLIVLEITLLSKDFETLILKLAEKNEYQINFHILAVSPKISDAFIQKRNQINNNVFEEERLTYKKSTKYFNKEFPKTFSYLSCLKNFDTEVVMWNVFDLEPCFCGRLKKSKKSFYKNRRLEKKLLNSEEDLLFAKTKFYMVYLA